MAASLQGRPRAPETIAMMTMEVGQSFLVPTHDRWQFVRSKLCRMKPRKFSVWKMGEEGWRVWRIA